MKLIRTNNEVTWFDWHASNLRLVAGGEVPVTQSGVGVVGLLGSVDGDGQWHCYELVKFGSNGIVEAWFDGTQVINKKGIYIKGSSTNTFEIPTNQWVSVSGNCQPIDVDDLVVSTTGRIGPFGASSSSSTSSST